MSDFLSQQLIFISTTFVLLLVPGYAFLRAIFHRNQFTPLERFVLSVPISFAIITLSVIALDAFGILLTQQVLLITISAVTLQFFVFALFIKHKCSERACPSTTFNFSKKQTTLITILIVFTILIKGMFLINTIFPTATDLGHHMFWVKKITTQQKLPNYKKIEIKTNEDNAANFTQPQNIADFIVGEHVIFAVIKILTGQSVVSTFPSLVLFVINIFSILTIFIFSRRLFARYKYGTHVAILTLLFIGPLWAVSGAQTKFVSGGVIGNILGNLLIPATLYFLYRALNTKNALLLIPTIVLGTTLAYTHHLSTLIFGYVFIFTFIGFVLLQRDGWQGYKNIFSLFKNYYVVPLILISLGALLILAPPSYLDKDAITSSIGTPSKSTRTGVPFEQLMYMLGSARFVFGIIGLLMLSGFAIMKRFGKFDNLGKKNHPTNLYGTLFLLGWGWTLLLMSLTPQLLKVNIISTRIATYGVFPLAILAGLSIIWIVHIIANRKKHSLIVPQPLVTTFLFCIIVFVFVSGIHDNARSMNDTPKTNKALQTFHTGDYTSKVFKKQIATNAFWIVKDHNYITSDTWLKVFYAYDYSFPLSRSYFKRYETHPNRETCTREMISAPKSEFAKKCFESLNVHAVIVNTQQDAGQFLNDDSFNRIYQNDELSVFIKK